MCVPWIGRTIILEKIIKCIIFRSSLRDDQKGSWCPFVRSPSSLADYCVTSHDDTRYRFVQSLSLWFLDFRTEFRIWISSLITMPFVSKYLTTVLYIDIGPYKCSVFDLCYCSAPDFKFADMRPRNVVENQNIVLIMPLYYQNYSWKLYSMIRD